MTPTTTTLRLEPESFRFPPSRAARRMPEADSGFETRFLDDAAVWPPSISRRPCVPGSAIPAAAARAEWRAFEGAWTADEAEAEAGGGRTGSGLARLERALDRVLPSPLGTLLQLFICVALALALMSAVLPLIDRL